jgi:universal stress protein E
MLELKRILLIAPSEMTRTPAFDRAHALALASGALLQIVAFDYVTPLELAGLLDHDAISQAREGYLQIHRHWLEQQIRFQRRAGLQVTSEVVWAKQSLAQVLAYVNDFHPDLVIKDVQHISALERTFHRPLDWLLLRECPACLHLVTDARHPKPLKVLAAIDLSHLEDLTYGLNERILELASTLARACDAQLEAFEALAERYDIEKAHQHMLAGIPHKVVSLFAQRNAFDMVVLGTTYHRRLDRMIGSTAESVLNHTACSLMIVKPADWVG